MLPPPHKRGPVVLQLVLALIGSGIRVIPYDAVPGVREFTHLGMAIEAMNLIVPIAAAFALGNAAEAHRRLEQGHVLGKIVLDIG